ncbi:MAG: putative zinc-binding metallopeptidase [Thermoanaerobaculia bacterium]
MSWREEREQLMQARISELNLRIEGSELEPLIAQLYRELDRAGIDYKPPIYLSDEWGCPEGIPIIGVPFYLANLQLSQIEKEIAENLETAEESIMYLRHEAGHALNYAYRLYEDEEWHEVFGPYSRPYIEDYRPNPFSRDYVRHIAGWYAQKHPDEDFAETFAVWLDPESNWRKEYQETAALRKLEYVDQLATRIGHEQPKVRPSRRDLPVEEMTYTVGDYYERRAEPRIEIPRWFDGDLKQLFDLTGEPAAPLLREKRLDLIGEVTYWTGVQLPVVRSLVDHLIDRTADLDLKVRDGSDGYVISFTAMVTTLALNYLHHESFAPEKVVRE